MILTERTINIIDHESIMDSPVVLYRGDKNVELKLNIKSSRFKFRDDDSSNFIESAQASYGQLIIQTPNQNEPIFSDITATKKGYIIFVITAEMIDEIDEVGAYTFQVRLLDSNKRSRATIPPVVNGIEIREPITSEDSNVLNSAVVGLASAANEEVLDTFDADGDYAKTNWKFGDKITAAKLNKAENGIYQSYALGLNNSSQLRDKASKQEVFLVKDGININDFDETTRATFLNAQGIDVNYVLGERNVKPVNTSFMDKLNLYDNKSTNDLGVNTSGTNYPLSGAYASDYIEIIKGTIYAQGINRICYYDNERKLVGQNVAEGSFFYKLTPPTNATKFRYCVASNSINVAFITMSNETIDQAEYGYKLPIEYIRDYELQKKIISMSDSIPITVDNCNFFTKYYNIYNNKSVNDLGISNSGTYYPLSGAYASDYIELKKYVYADKIGNVCWYDENKSFVSVDMSGKDAKKLDIPKNAKYFRYMVSSGNINIASIYNVDEEVPEFPPKTKLDNNYLDMNFINNAITEKNKYTTTIACYGDSLTEGAGSTNAGVYSYPTRLQGIINTNAESYQVRVLNRGIGGNTSKPIVAKSGCYADMVEPFTIPVNTTPVAITKNGILANNVGGTISIRNGVNPVTIGGIEGNLSYADGTYKFARLEAGEEVQITRPTQILPSASKTDKNAILVICVGTNDADKTEADYPPKLIQRIRRMIEYLDCKEFIVLGLTVGGKENVNPALEEEFGANFLDIHKYLINYGLSDNGLTATSEDLEDINNGLIPRQIRSDSVHYNNKGYYSKAMGVYLKGKDLGYWK